MAARFASAAMCIFTSFAICHRPPFYGIICAMNNERKAPENADKTLTLPEVALGFVLLALFIVCSAFILSALAH